MPVIAMGGTVREGEINGDGSFTRMLSIPDEIPESAKKWLGVLSSTEADDGDRDPDDEDDGTVVCAESLRGSCMNDRMPG
jgi:hypothetical protein